MVAYSTCSYVRTSWFCFCICITLKEKQKRENLILTLKQKLYLYQENQKLIISDILKN